jgi:hypothetical protein
VIVGDFHVVCVAGDPPEADAPLLVDADTVLAASVAFECFQPVGRRNSQIIHGGGLADHCKFVQGSLLNVGGDALGMLFIPDFLGFLVSETPNHLKSICYFRLASIAV